MICSRQRAIYLSAPIFIFLIYLVLREMVEVSLYCAQSADAQGLTAAEKGSISSLSPESINVLDGPGAVPFFRGEKVATIIETRALDNLIPLILHFSAVLGPEWPIVLFTPLDILPKSASAQRLMSQGRLFIRDLPDGTHFSNHASVSTFLTKPWFWHQLAPADHVLIFQADSMICANSLHSVEDFLSYDLVRAPIAEHFGDGYNGGLSLRNRNMILDIISASDFANATHDTDDTVNIDFEDQWFYQKMKELPSKISSNGSTVPGANLPPREVAMKFAVETIPYDSPLGYHQPARWQPHNMEQIERWCPEVRMVTDDLIVLQGHEPAE